MRTLIPPGRRRRVAAAVAGAAAVFALVLLGSDAVFVSGPVRMVEVTGRPTPTWPASPFAGTPAEHFAEGAAGIVLPPAEAVPDAYVEGYPPVVRDVTAAEVASALEQVKAVLVGARLDEAMLLDHDLDPFFDALAPAHWEHWKDELPRVREFYASAGFARHATMLAPEVTVAAEPRVAGQITYRPAIDHWGTSYWDEPKEHMVLKVSTRFVWVYALEVPGGGVGIVVIRDEASWLFPTDYRLLTYEPNDGVHRNGSVVEVWGVDCDLYAEEGRVRPDLPASGFAPAVFDPGRSLYALDGGCHPDEVIWPGQKIRDGCPTLPPGRTEPVAVQCALPPPLS